MLSVLVFFAGAVISEAGIPRQTNDGFGLHYPLASNPIIRPALIRSHVNPRIGLSPVLNTPGPIFRTTLFASPLLFSPAQFSYKPISPHTISHIVPPILYPSISQYSISPAPTITRIPPPTVLSPTPISHAVIGHSLTSSHTIPSYYKFGQEVPKKSVSYSLSERDYQYLKRHKTEGKDSPYNPVPGFDTASHSEKHQNSHSHDGKDRDTSNKLTESGTLLKRSVVLNDGYQGYNEPSLINVPEPLVTKDIYFHVPPPDFEEPPPVSISLPQPKKTYNLVFIKVPAQEQQNDAFLQQLQSRQSLIEDKTLIYVLSKKQDPPTQVVLPPQEISSPEVFFVKYNTKQGDITQISNELVEERILENTPVLERKRRLEDCKSDS